MVTKIWYHNLINYTNNSDIFKVTTSRTDDMRHLIERVLELEGDKKVDAIIDDEPTPSNDQALENLLRTLTPRIRVYGC